MQAAVACLLGNSDMATALEVLAKAEADLDVLIILHSMVFERYSWILYQLLSAAAYADKCVVSPVNFEHSR